MWLLTEIALTAIGTDDIADYGEYIFKMKDLMASRPAALVEYVCDSQFCVPHNLNPRLTKIFPG